MYRIFLLVFLLLPAIVFADEGSSALPSVPCQVEKIKCSSYQDKGLCDRYLNNPAYTLAGGEVGASVQNYEFCPTEKIVSTPQFSEIAFFTAGVLIFISGIIGFILMKRRVSEKKQ